MSDVLQLLNWFSEHICCGSGLLFAALLIAGALFKPLVVINRKDEDATPHA